MGVLSAILGLGFLIFLHELGHLLAARAVGLPVVRFSIGMGPVVFSRTFGGLEYALSLLPFGGYVQFDAEHPDYEGAALWRKHLTAFAGPLANFAVGVLLYILASSLDVGQIAIVSGLDKSATAMEQLFHVLGLLFSGQVSLNELGGPVMMVNAGASLAHNGVAFLQYLGFLSLNLAVFNLLPIPALDGGQILLLLATGIMGRAPSERVQTALVGGSFILLFGLILYVTAQDVGRLL